MGGAQALFGELISELHRYVAAALASPEELLAVASVLIAAAFVLVSSFVKTMIPLRWLAVGSNLGFIGYGALHPSYPMLLLHLALLPINLIRWREMVRLTKRVRKAEADADRSGVWLKPYMRSSKRRAGSILFRKGDRGDRIYMLVEGRIELVEIQTSINPGTILGELALFSPNRRRALTARCAEPCTVLSIDEQTVKELFYQNPAFGFKMVELVAGRLSFDVQRVTDQLTEARAEIEQLRGQLAARVDIND
jgi:CRP-like cAMP-binding protein